MTTNLDALATSNSPRRRHRLRWSRVPGTATGAFVLATIALAACHPGASDRDERGTLALSVVDGVTGQPTPARIEALDANGTAHVAEDALPVGLGYSERDHAWEGDIHQALALLSPRVENPYTRTTQFYSTGTSELSLPPGTYELRLYKGTEYEVQTREVQVAAGERAELTVTMSRWVNMPEEGWYSADDHLHISRPVEELNPFISKWMQAEDVHVANLLQFGSWNRFFASPQYEHGPDGVYREGNYLLASGQENPRTHFLGHGIILGLPAPLQFTDGYVVYRRFWEEARRQGALSGYAHWGTGSEARMGLAIDLPSELVDFLEVLEAHDASYDVWYDTLDMGFRLTPTAGTDYGSLPSLPGRERFYTRVKGPLTHEAWLDGVRSGQTFVTNGPVLDFRIQDKSMGEEVVLDRPATVRVEARVRFDPARDDVARLEVIQNGSLLKSLPRVGPDGEIRGSFEAEIAESSWLAVRVSGHKRGEAVPPEGLIPPYRDRYRGAYATHAHSAPIFVTLRNGPGLSQQPRATVLTRAWIARLEELETRLADENLDFLAREPGGDVPSAEYLREGRAALLEATRSAKERYTKQKH